MRPQPKSGHLFCTAYLAFVRRLPCFFCGTSPCEAHHFPPKGRGVTRDDRTIAVCRECHMRCGGQRVNGKPPIDKEKQVIAEQITRLAFFEECSDEDYESYGVARKARRQRLCIA